MTLDRGPNRGRNGLGGRAVYKVVPDPAASATNACGTAAAAVRAVVSSPADRAGRSASSAARPRPGQRSAACVAPAISARLRPAPPSATVTAPSGATSEATAGSSLTTTTAPTSG